MVLTCDQASFLFCGGKRTPDRRFQGCLYASRSQSTGWAEPLPNQVLFFLKANTLKVKPLQLERKSKDRPHGLPMWFLWSASHYQSLQIAVLLLQVCLLGSLALSRTLLLQHLHSLQQDRRFRFLASLFSCCLKTDNVASCLRYRQRCLLNSVPVEKMVWRPFYILIFASLHCSY